MFLFGIQILPGNIPSVCNTDVSAFTFIALPTIDNFGQLLVPGLESRLDSVVARQMKYSAAITLLETIIKRNADLFAEKDWATAESAIAFFIRKIVLYKCALL